MNLFRRLVAGLVVVLALSAGSAPAEAQRRPDGRPGMDREALERRLRARFAEIMRERLALTEAESRALGAVLSSFEDDRQALRRDELALRREVEVYLARGADDDGRARELLAEMSGLRDREAELFQREQDSLLEVLTPAQLVRFHAIREELSQRVRRLRGGPPGRTHERRPGGEARDASRQSGHGLVIGGQESERGLPGGR